VRRCARRDRTGRRPTPRGPGRLPQGSTQRPAPPGERLPHSPLPCGGRRQGPRPCARYCPARARSPHTVFIGGDAHQYLVANAIVTFAYSTSQSGRRC
jgi:hypothetical protein